MPISGKDCLKAGEFVKFLESIGFHNLANEFDSQWNLQVEKQGNNEDEERASLVDREVVPAMKSTPKKLTLKSLDKKHLTVCFVGDPSDLYAHTEERVIPSFPHGAGYDVEKFAMFCTEGIEMVPYSPYTRQTLPSNLPLEKVMLPIFMEMEKAGLEPQRDFPVVKGSIIAGQYIVERRLDVGAFSRVVSCVEEKTKKPMCLKIIKNTKESFDQSIDEVKLLLLLQRKGDPDKHCILRLHDFFYFKEHLFLVTELLKENLYKFGESSRRKKEEPYFTLARLQAITRQLLTALRFLHDQKLMHGDLKPENVVFRSYNECTVKLIDFGNCGYITDSLSSYVQSRPYRSPEVILGCKYDTGIDIWSLGVMLPELATGKLLFNSDSIPALFASITAICGPLPTRLLHEGRNTLFFVSKHGAFYQKAEGKVLFHFPASQLNHSNIFGFDDPEYVNFVEKCLTLDPATRPTAEELSRHPFLDKDYGSCFCSWEEG